ncbi:hypothetical protein N5J66_13700 [Pseudomonas juntendi]|uniref:Uncharacterized protein n=1 Tax=Pseudomonas monteilii TaxID=76759 RepID=A0A7X3F5Q8_9PSED|nr:MULTISPECIES: hypothetical protein [Pseudomonas]MDH2015016.1 hypothetical protein [Pseudomonas juntendi]MVF51766.1 hypothetical protein [Pseudomonas monteilii]
MKKNNFMTAFARAVERRKQTPANSQALQATRSSVTKTPTTKVSAPTKSTEFDATGYRIKVMTAYYHYMQKRGNK